MPRWAALVGGAVASCVAPLELESDPPDPSSLLRSLGVVCWALLESNLPGLAHTCAYEHASTPCPTSPAAAECRLPGFALVVMPRQQARRPAPALCSLRWPTSPLYPIPPPCLPHHTHTHAHGTHAHHLCTCPHPPPLPPPLPYTASQVLVKIAYLRSWDPIMGSMVLTCASGCTCDPLPVSSLNTQTHDSQMALAALTVTQHRECIVAITTLVSPRSEGPGGEGGGGPGKRGKGEGWGAGGGTWPAGVCWGSIARCASAWVGVRLCSSLPWMVA